MTNPEDPREKFRRLLDSEADTQGEAPADDSSTKDTTPVVHHPAIDENGMPLPRRVEEIDMGATRVTPSAFEYTPSTRVHRPVTSRSVQPSRRRPINWSKAGGCLLRGSIVFIFIVVAVGLIMAAAGIYEY